jgi:hypothetical protein
MPDGELVEYGNHIPEPITPAILGDIKPYQSMIDGSHITSRSQHREHLKAHGCVEVGNEHRKMLKAYDNLPDVAPQQRKEIIRAQVDAMTQREFKAAIKRDVDRVKWNSRER